MSHAPAHEPLASPLEYASATVLPWIFSLATHVGALLSLALMLPVAGTIKWDLFTSGHPVEVTVTPGSSDTTAEEAVGLSGGSGDFENDGQDPPNESITALGGGRPSLAAVLNEQPPVDLAGILPAADESLDAPPTGGEGEGVGGGIGDAVGPGQGAGRRGPPGLGTVGKARTGVFGLKSEGYKFVYVFDRSASMDGYGGAPLAAAKTQLLASLGDLGATHQFQVIFYNDKPHVFTPSGTAGRLVFGTEQNKELAARFIGGIIGSGATEHEKALKLALQLAPDVIFFLTDAGDPKLDDRQLAAIGRLNRGTLINTIEYGYGVQVEYDNFLVRLARENGGNHVYVDIAKFEPVQ